jgi:hypothetical protein
LARPGPHENYESHSKAIRLVVGLDKTKFRTSLNEAFHSDLTTLIEMTSIHALFALSDK